MLAGAAIPDNPMKIMLVALAKVITLALLTQSVVAQDLIQMTENSPTSLLVTLELNNGSHPSVSVSNTSADHWTLTFPTTISFNEVGSGVGWIEPENSANGNIVTSPSQNNVLFVESDALGHPGDHTDGMFVVVGLDTGGKEEVAKFTDQAAAIEAAPESATWGVGALLAGLLFLHFFLRKRAA